MVTIGENLQYERNEVVDVEKGLIRLKSTPDTKNQILISEIKTLELTGVKSNSGFSGTMEWGMRNPTFILPTTIWNNIISLFKKRDDILYYLVTLSDDKKSIIYCSNGRINQKLQQITQR